MGNDRDHACEIDLRAKLDVIAIPCGDEVPAAKRLLKTLGEWLGRRHSVAPLSKCLATRITAILGWGCGRQSIDNGTTQKQILFSQLTIGSRADDRQLRVRAEPIDQSGEVSETGDTNHFKPGRGCECAGPVGRRHHERFSGHSLCVVLRR